MPAPGASSADDVPYVDTLVREYLLYRGFTSALASFDDERAMRGADAALDVPDRVVSLVFHRQIPRLDVHGLVRTLSLLRERFFTRLDASYADAIARLESSVAALFVVTACERDRRDKIAELFEREGDRLASADPDFARWFAVLYAERPADDPRFAPFFAASWADAIVVTARNFLATVFAAQPLPTVLKFAERRRETERLRKRVENAERETARLRAALEAREAELARVLQEQAARDKRRAKEETKKTAAKAAAAAAAAAATAAAGGGNRPTDLPPSRNDAGGSVDLAPACSDVDDSETNGGDSSKGRRPEAAGSESEERSRAKASSGFDGASAPAPSSRTTRRVVSATTSSFAWHDGAVTSVRFAPDGASAVSGGEDGVVRAWTLARAGRSGARGPDSDGATKKSKSSSRAPEAAPTLDAWTRCGASSVAAIEWDRRRRDRVLVASGGASVRAWDAERGVLLCEGFGDEAVGATEDLRRSPVSDAFCRAASDGRGRGALEMWNAKTHAVVGSLPLVPEEGAEASENVYASGFGPAPLSVAFNHNGKMLAAACGDGCVRLYDLHAEKQIMRWRAVAEGPGAASVPATSLAFSHDQNAVFVLGADGVAREWSLHRLKTKLREIDLKGGGSRERAEGEGLLASGARVHKPGLALDPTGRGLAASTARGARLILLDPDGSHADVSSALPAEVRKAPATCVDWHPTDAVAAFGAADKTVTVASLKIE